MKELISRLKSGEYNGADIMKAWLAIEDLQTKLKEADSEFELLKKTFDTYVYTTEDAIAELVKLVEEWQMNPYSFEMATAERFLKALLTYDLSKIKGRE